MISEGSYRGIKSVYVRSLRPKPNADILVFWFIDSSLLQRNETYMKPSVWRNKDPQLARSFQNIHEQAISQTSKPQKAVPTNPFWRPRSRVDGKGDGGNKAQHQHDVHDLSELPDENGMKIAWNIFYSHCWAVLKNILQTPYTPPVLLPHCFLRSYGPPWHLSKKISRSNFYGFSFEARIKHSSLSIVLFR